MNRYAVATVSYGNDFKELGTVTHQTIKAYADKIGADFIVLDQLGNHKYPHFIKFDLDNLLSTYDRVLYVDTDIVIRDDAPNLFDIVPENKLGILQEFPCTSRDPVFVSFLNKQGYEGKWNNRYYNTGVMVLSKSVRNIFTLDSEEFFHFGEQTYINYNICRFNVDIHSLDWKFNRMNSHNEYTKEWRFSAYFMHYAAYLGHPNTVELVKDIIKKDLKVWDKYKPHYAFPQNKNQTNSSHQEYIENSNNLSTAMIGDKPFYFRNGTSDGLILSKNFYSPTNQEYEPEYITPELPEPPKVVFDIGANIGVISYILSQKYPSAMVYSFEPEKENFEILKMNTEGLSNVKIFNFGLSDKTTTVKLHKPTENLNYGSYSMFTKGISEEHQEIEIKSITEFMTENNINKIDVVKIDCEGAEYDILTSIKLDDITWIEGECHGINDFKLIDYISKTHIVGMKKKLDQIHFNFHGLNKKFAPKYSY